MRLALSAAALLASALGLLAGCAPVQDRLFETGRKVMRQQEGLQAGRVEAGRHTLGYLERSGDRGTIVLLHGFASEKDVWLRFIGHLPDGFRVIALDLPGHGDSTRDRALDYDVPSMTRAVAQALDFLAPESVHLAGSSLGGMVATLYAAGHPRRVRTLALYAAAGVYPPEPSEFQRRLDAGENPLVVRDGEDFDELIALVFHNKPLMPWPVRPAIERYAVARAAFNEKMWNDLWVGHQTLDAELPGVSMPVLLVWGDRDRVLDPSSVRVFESLLPDVETVIMERTGHSSVNERPRLAARHYVEFLLAEAGGGGGAEHSVASPSSAGVR